MELKAVLLVAMSVSGSLLLTGCGGSSGDSAAGAMQNAQQDSPGNTTNPNAVSEGDSVSGTESGMAAEDDPVTGDDDQAQPPSNASSEGDERPVYQTAEGIVECSDDDIKARVDFDMRDYYIYYDQVPQLDAADFETPEQFIRALRVDPDIYSFVTDQREREALVEEGLLTSYGVNFRPANDGVVRFREILRESPAELAGILRGDELIRLNGRLIGEFDRDALDEAFSDDRPTIDLQIRTLNDEPRELTLERTTFRWRTAFSYAYNNENFATTGLLEVRRFLETTEQEIDAQLDFLIESGIENLIIDLRYNPGGRTRVAERLAAQIIGPSSEGLPFLSRRWNDKYSENDSTSTLEAAEPSLSFPRIIVLLSERSASASEAFVNGLEPYIDVVVIGERTEGKIFTSNSRDYCGKSINAMRSERTNSVGVSILGGIQPDCSVADDWTEPAFSPSDPLTFAALSFVQTGSCPDVVTASPALNHRKRSTGPSLSAVSESLDARLDLVD